jgi:hypothetical protein
MSHIKDRLKFTCKKEQIMKRIFMSILFIALLAGPVVAATLNAETASKGIMGNWKLFSFEREGQPARHYQDQVNIWTFDGKKFTVKSEDLGGEIQDSYHLLRSMFRIRTTIIILSEKLKNTHLPHGNLLSDRLKMISSPWETGTIRSPIH